MSTITDVARVAGVSVATVSRALRGLDRVNPETRARVRRVAAELEYVASPTAASLASGRTRIVGVVAPFLTRWFFATVISGIEKSLREHGYHVLLFDLEDESYDRRMRLTQIMLGKRVDGLIVLNIPLDEEEHDLIDRLALPVVTVGNRVGAWPCVGIDDGAAMLLAVRHLVDLGHRKIAYLGVVAAASAYVQTPRDRLTAFQAGLLEAGLSCPPSWLLESDWSADGGARDTVALLSSRRRPTAIACASDEMAYGVISTARRLGLRVPEDLSVIGIDDHTLAGVLDLSTVRQEVDAQGRHAGTLLMRHLLGESIPDHTTDLFPCTLIPRGSTAQFLPPSRSARASGSRK